MDNDECTRDTELVMFHWGESGVSLLSPSHSFALLIPLLDPLSTHSTLHSIVHCILHYTAGKVGMERWEGSVAMATSRRHWTEQSMQITKTEVLLRRNHDAIRVR